jgi:hypothetical protein
LLLLFFVAFLRPPIPEEVGSVYDVVFESPLNKMKDSDVLTGLVQVINTLLPTNTTSYTEPTSSGIGGSFPLRIRISNSLSIIGLRDADDECR